MNSLAEVQTHACTESISEIDVDCVMNCRPGLTQDFFKAGIAKSHWLTALTPLVKVRTRVRASTDARVRSCVFITLTPAPAPPVR
jgi:hypothetical protein